MIEFQRLILGDARRNELFAKALRRVIVPGTFSCRQNTAMEAENLSGLQAP